MLIFILMNFRKSVKVSHDLESDITHSVIPNLYR